VQALCLLFPEICNHAITMDHNEPQMFAIKTNSSVVSNSGLDSGPRIGPADRSLHRFANPGYFLRVSGAVLPWLAVSGFILTVAGLVWGLFFAPADWQQGDAVRIMYVHVPSAWLASAGYLALAVCSLLSLVWRHPLADLTAREIGPVGGSFTAVCLATGSLWGKPMWGAWWVWDARLTSVLVLLFLYLGHMTLVRAFDDPQRGYRAGAILALVGVVNLPIIKFSVDWWNTLHQPASISLTGAPTMYTAMLWPLFIAAVGYTMIFAAIVIARTRAAIMERRIRALLLARVTFDASGGVPVTLAPG
jgi:heme exporter protein C